MALWTTTTERESMSMYSSVDFEIHSIHEIQQILSMNEVNHNVEQKRMQVINKKNTTTNNISDNESYAGVSPFNMICSTANPVYFGLSNVKFRVNSDGEVCCWELIDA